MLSIIKCFELFYCSIPGLNCDTPWDNTWLLNNPLLNNNINQWINAFRCWIFSALCLKIPSMSKMANLLTEFMCHYVAKMAFFPWYFIQANLFIEILKIQYFIEFRLEKCSAPLSPMNQAMNLFQIFLNYYILNILSHCQPSIYLYIKRGSD